MVQLITYWHHWNITYYFWSSMSTMEELFLLHCMNIHIMWYMLLFIKWNRCVLTDMANNSTYAWVRQLCKNMNGYMKGANCGEDCVLTACQLTYKMSTWLYSLVMIIINWHCNYVWHAWISRPATSNSQMRLFEFSLKMYCKTFIDLDFFFHDLNICIYKI